ncbi:tetratricopeptide repeat protein [Pseudomarimonas salicorniae]|uniref:Tetratricopeptide repeat protein n=1 Tax=Pseudomarimonas salicorniae TaxID=2933270 RepID=A0ABT0GIN5_9GAMM|nr:tetratricopeptide repeat protein [Lysobacter sp. CAU 1642]MCK7594059.1 tetratricopeptide repeat protein [Lysobacter sp. CAU 1642]
MAQHPLFLRFGELYRAERFEEALAILDRLEQALPGAPQVSWHRANCLEKLERYDEVAAALDRVLEGAPDYVPAIIKRVRYTPDGFADEDDDDELPEGQLMQRAAERAERARESSRFAESELRRALSLQPDNVDGLELLSNVLRYREDEELDASRVEAEALLDRAIELAPDRVDLIETRANTLRSDALCGYAEGDENLPASDPDLVQTYAGLRYHRPTLERALADYDRCLALTGHHRYAVRLGMVLHDLGRFDEALARYDQALAQMEPADPTREHVCELRERSEDQGAGEREQVARLLERGLTGEGDRSLQDDLAAQAVIGAAQAVRHGRSLQEALDSRLSEDPETLVAMNIAQQILNTAHEPPPQLEEVDPARFPLYQRRYVERIGRDIAPLGLDYIGDAEATGLFPMLGQHVLIRFFADGEGEIGIAAFAIRPKWPGLSGFLRMLLARQWKSHGMLECVSQFEDGTHLSTQFENPSPFRYEGAVQIERLPVATPVRDLVARHLERHAAYKAGHPGVRPLIANDVEGMDLRWREGQMSKREYRRSIGYISDAELRQLLGDNYDQYAVRVREQLALLAEDYA